MMHVPDHLSVTGLQLTPLEHANNLMSKIEAARSALLEQMSVPDHINVDGGAKNVMPDEQISTKTIVRMEVPSTLNVFHLSADTNHNFQTSNNLDETLNESTDVMNPYEEVEQLRNKFLSVACRLKETERKLQRQEKREKYWIATLIGAAITISILLSNLRK